MIPHNSARFLKQADDLGCILNATWSGTLAGSLYQLVPKKVRTVLGMDGVYIGHEDAAESLSIMISGGPGDIFDLLLIWQCRKMSYG